MKLIVDQSQRFAKMRAHTATHLLHAELGKIFPNTKQAWSLVDDDLLRFDFQADKMLTVDELQNIEKNINDTIYQSLEVSCQEMPIDQAQKLWAKAFFDEKYWDEVRVVYVQSQLSKDSKYLSIELCWGTHVQNTKDIWAFVIINQEAVASGIKRISAYTGPKVLERLQETKSILFHVAQKLWVKAENQILDKLEKELKEKEEMLSRFESINTKTIIDSLQNWDYPSNDDFDSIINVSSHSILKNLDFKDIVFQAKWLFQNKTLVVFNQEGWFALISTKEGASAKVIAQKLWLRWWWNDNIVQGKDTQVLSILD